jgi:hypothetical protein
VKRGRSTRARTVSESESDWEEMDESERTENFLEEFYGAYSE